MAVDQFLHGIESIEMNIGPRTIVTPRAGTIGLVGPMPGADDARIPVGKPTLLNTGLPTDVAACGTEGWAAKAMRFWSRMGGYFVVMVRTAPGATPAETLSNVIGGVDAEANNTGIQAFLDGESVAKVKPRILIAPGFSHELATAGALADVGDRLSAISFPDAPADGNYNDAISFRQEFGNRGVFPVWPEALVWDDTENDYVPYPMSIVAAAVEADTDYFKSSSNTVIDAVYGTSKPVHFEIDNPNTVANLLSEHGVTTIVEKLGKRLWGNQGATDDPLWKYRAHVRLDYMLREALVHAHLWAVDKNITRTYADSVMESVNSYLRYLAGPGVGAIAGGRCWLDPAVNTPDQMEAGKVTFDFDYGRFGVAEHIAFRRFLNQGYVEEIFANG